MKPILETQRCEWVLVRRKGRYPELPISSGRPRLGQIAEGAQRLVWGRGCGRRGGGTAAAGRGGELGRPELRRQMRRPVGQGCSSSRDLGHAERFAGMWRPAGSSGGGRASDARTGRPMRRAVESSGDGQSAGSRGPLPKMWMATYAPPNMGALFGSSSGDCFLYFRTYFG